MHAHLSHRSGRCLCVACLRVCFHWRNSGDVGRNRPSVGRFVFPLELDVGPMWVQPVSTETHIDPHLLLPPRSGPSPGIALFLDVGCQLSSFDSQSANQRRSLRACGSSRRGLLLVARKRSASGLELFNIG